MGVIAMHQSAVPIIAATLVFACGSPTPEPPVQRAPETGVQAPAPAPRPAPRVVQPDPGLVAKAVAEAEAAIEVAENPGWYLQKPVNHGRYNYAIPLEVAKAAYDSAPETTREAYAASAAAYTAANKYNSLENGHPNADLIKNERDIAFRRALANWKEHQ